MTRAVSLVAANPAVRTELRSRQREWAKRHGGGVIEGRDIGTVVFPDAATEGVPDGSGRRSGRPAGRRRSPTSTTRRWPRDIARRDALDQGREDSPLQEADDSVVVDTSERSIDEIVDDLLVLLEAAGDVS